MTRVGAIDIGTNSVRLLVAERDLATGTVAEVDRRTTITRLGEGVDAARVLQPEAVARTLLALRAYREVLDDADVNVVRAVATSAVRDAANRDAFVADVAAALGVEPEVLSGTEEAELSFAGATTGINRRALPGPYLVVDIGGGSTELIVGHDAPEMATSLDVGCVRITEAFLASDPPAPEELSNAVGLVRDLLADADRVLPGARAARTCIGVAGTILTVAALELGGYDRAKTHGFFLERAAVEDIFRTLATETREERRHNPGLEPGRVDVIVGGLIVLAAVLRHYDLPGLVCSESDLLDGLAARTQ